MSLGWGSCVVVVSLGVIVMSFVSCGRVVEWLGGHCCVDGWWCCLCMLGMERGGGVHQVNNDQSCCSLFGCHVTDGSDVAPGSSVNKERKGGEYSPGMKMMNDN